MHCIIIILICIIRYCSSENNSGSKPIVLNISRSRPRDINVLRQTYYSIDTLVYTAIDGYISEVVDDKGNIWKSQKGPSKFTRVTKFHDESRLLHIYSEYNYGNAEVTYYYRTGRVWNEVSDEIFYDEFHNFITAYSNIGDFTLYLNKNNNEKTARINKPENDQYAAYSSNYGYQINKVCDVGWWVFCFKSVWVAKDHNDQCLFASVHKQKNPDMAYLVISTKDKVVDKFYVKSTKGLKRWDEVDKSTYIEKLKSRGLDPDNFDNNVELNLDDVDNNKFYTSGLGYKQSKRVSYPRPGYRISKVSYNKSLIWEPKSPNCYCHYVNLFLEEDGLGSCYLLVSEGSERRVEYYINTDDGWSLVEKKKFYDLLADKGQEPRYTHLNLGLDKDGNRTLETSYFTNKRGLIVRTYRSMVPNHKGVLLLSHGLRAHFMSTVLKFNIDWNYKYFGFITHPFIVCPDVKTFYDFGDYNVYRHKFIFEYNFYDSSHSYDKMPLLEYSGGLLECLNNMGFSVYGMDLQSHGFSEGITSRRSHVKSYYDYFDDVIQYVHIIKRDKFLDRIQVYSEDVWSEEVVYKEKFYLFGFSLAANLFMRSVQEYFKRYQSTKVFTDGIISVSGMLDIKNDLRNPLQRFFYKVFIPMLGFFFPTVRNKCQHFLDFGSTYEFTVFLNDDKYSPHRFTWKTLDTLFKSCDNIIKYKKHYPKNLPTLLIHSTEDPGCSIRGIRAVVSKMMGYDIESQEINGNYHHVYKTESLHFIVKFFGEWIDNIQKSNKAVICL